MSDLNIAAVRTNPQFKKNIQDLLIIDDIAGFVGKDGEYQPGYEPASFAANLIKRGTLGLSKAAEHAVNAPNANLSNIRDDLLGKLKPAEKDLYYKLRKKLTQVESKIDLDGAINEIPASTEHRQEIIDLLVIDDIAGFVDENGKYIPGYETARFASNVLNISTKGVSGETEVKINRPKADLQAIKDELFSMLDQNAKDAYLHLQLKLTKPEDGSDLEEALCELDEACSAEKERLANAASNPGEPDWVSPLREEWVGGKEGNIFKVTIDGKAYNIKINPFIVGKNSNGQGRKDYLYPHYYVLRLDEDLDGIVITEELRKGLDPSKRESYVILNSLSGKHPNGIKALPLDEAIKAIAKERDIFDADGHKIDFGPQAAPATLTASDMTDEERRAEAEANARAQAEMKAEHDAQLKADKEMEKRAREAEAKAMETEGLRIKEEAEIAKEEERINAELREEAEVQARIDAEMMKSIAVAEEKAEAEKKARKKQEEKIFQGIKGSIPQAEYAKLGNPQNLDEMAEALCKEKLGKELCEEFNTLNDYRSWANFFSWSGLIEGNDDSLDFISALNKLKEKCLKYEAAPRGKKISLQEKGKYYYYDINQEDGEKQLYPLMEAANNEESWIYVDFELKGERFCRWYEIGKVAQNKDGEINYFIIAKLLKQGAQVNNVSIYHIHPDKSGAEAKIPSANDIDMTLGAVKELSKWLNFNLDELTSQIVVPIGAGGKYLVRLKKVQDDSTQEVYEKIGYYFVGAGRGELENGNFDPEKFAKDISSQFIIVEYAGREKVRELIEEGNAGLKRGEKNGDPQELKLARDGFNEALRLMPENIAAKKGAGWAEYRLGNYGKALKFFDAAIKETKKMDEEALRGRGWVLYDINKLDDSLRAFMLAVEAIKKGKAKETELNDNEADACRGLAKIYIRTAESASGEEPAINYNRAVEYLTKAIDIAEQQSAEDYYLRGKYYKLLKKSVEAEADIDKACQLEPAKYCK